MILKFILKTSRDIDLVQFYSKNARGTPKKEIYLLHQQNPEREISKINRD